MGGWMDRWMCKWVKAWIINLPHWIGTVWFSQAINRDKFPKQIQSCLVFSFFSDQWLLHEVDRMFYSLSIWDLWNLAKVWYLVLFLFLVLTLRLLSFLSLSASIDASWPTISVNLLQPGLGWLCQCSKMLGFAGNPHGSLSHDVTQPLSPFFQPSSFHCTKPHRKMSLRTDLEERWCLRLSATFPCAHNTAKTIVYRRKLKCMALKSHSWKMQSQDSNPGLLTSEPVLISPQQKMFSLSFHWDGGAFFLSFFLSHLHSLS